jgi:hypothetical protein
MYHFYLEPLTLSTGERLRAGHFSMDYLDALTHALSFLAIENVYDRPNVWDLPVVEVPMSSYNPPGCTQADHDRAYNRTTPLICRDCGHTEDDHEGGRCNHFSTSGYQRDTICSCLGFVPWNPADTDASYDEARDLGEI